MENINEVLHSKALKYFEDAEPGSMTLTLENGDTVTFSFYSGDLSNQLCISDFSEGFFIHLGGAYIECHSKVATRIFIEDEQGDSNV